jgi:hypothetical protein
MSDEWSIGTGSAPELHGSPPLSTPPPSVLLPLGGGGEKEGAGRWGAFVGCRRALGDPTMLQESPPPCSQRVVPRCSPPIVVALCIHDPMSDSDISVKPIRLILMCWICAALAPWSLRGACITYVTACTSVCMHHMCHSLHLHWFNTYSWDPATHHALGGSWPRLQLMGQPGHKWCPPYSLTGRLCCWLGKGRGREVGGVWWMQKALGDPLVAALCRGCAPGVLSVMGF